MRFHIKDYIQNSLLVKNIRNSFVIILGFLIFAVIIVFLLPPQYESAAIGEGFFVNVVMIVPLAAAVFFILLSFRFKIHQNVIYSRSIRTKIALALISIAVVPTVPIVIITSNIVNATINQFFTEKTMSALRMSVNLANERIYEKEEELIQYVEKLRHDLENNHIAMSDIANPSFEKRYEFAGHSVYVSTIQKKGVLQNNIIPVAVHGGNDNLKTAVKTFLGLADVSTGVKSSRLSVFNETYAVAYTQYRTYCLAMATLIPKEMFQKADYINASFSEYKKQEFLKPYFQTGIGMALVIISIGIVFMAILLSLILSRSITRPVFELVEASEKIAKADFSINLVRSEQDEIAVLYESFNQMAMQLDHSQKMMFQAQKLQAWSQVARKLIHEIKNPLTPIRLSAERLHRRYAENHPDFPVILNEATSIIVEEVNLLMTMLSEFSKFARLPEIRLQRENINAIIENCVAMYASDKIAFSLNLDAHLSPPMCDRTLLRQAFLNIIQNAIEANASTITIASGFTNADKAIKIVFNDDGTGVSPDNISKVFDPTFSTKASGMGLGLAIVEKIIIDHKGTIQCESIEGQWTQFTVTIPVD